MRMLAPTRMSATGKEEMEMREASVADGVRNGTVCVECILSVAAAAEQEVAMLCSDSQRHVRLVSSAWAASMRLTHAPHHE